MPKPAVKPVIAIDVDEVLSPMFPHAVDWHNARYGTKLTLADNFSGDTKVWGTENLEEAKLRFQKFMDSHVRAAKPFDEAQAVLEKLCQNYELIVITARDAVVEQITVDWVEKHFPKAFSAVHFKAKDNIDSRGKHKSDVLKQLKARYFIDDALHNVLHAAESGIETLLFGDYPWNKTDELPANVTRVKDWPAVLEYFDGRAGR